MGRADAPGYPTIPVLNTASPDTLRFAPKEMPSTTVPSWNVSVARSWTGSSTFSAVPRGARAERGRGQAGRERAAARGARCDSWSAHLGLIRPGAALKRAPASASTSTTSRVVAAATRGAAVGGWGGGEAAARSGCGREAFFFLRRGVRVEPRDRLRPRPSNPRTASPTAEWTRFHFLRAAH